MVAQLLCEDIIGNIIAEILSASEKAECYEEIAMTIHNVSLL